MALSLILFDEKYMKHKLNGTSNSVTKFNQKNFKVIENANIDECLFVFIPRN